MNKKINILSLILCVSLIIIICTGSYKVDLEELSTSLGTYQSKHKVYHNAYKGFVAVNIISERKNNNIEELNSPKQIPKQETKGLYYVEFETYFKYIKFYEDSSVVTFTTNMPPEKASRWVEDQLKDAPRGTYSTSNENIVFTTIQKKTEGREVKVEYKGKKLNGKLHLSSYSLATKNQSDLVYRYFK